MQVYNIVFEDMKDKEDFIKLADKAPYEIDIKHGSLEIDAKSAMGIAILPLSKELICTFYTNDTDDINVKETFSRWIKG